MNSVESYNPTALNFNRLNPSRGQRITSQSSQAKISSQRSIDLSLVTAEGDKVTLSANAAFQAGYATYNSQGTLNGVTSVSQGESFEASLEREFSISVEGDLNKQELKDIRKALKNIIKIAKKFFKGDLDNAFVKALRLRPPDTIASLDASFQTSVSASFAQQVSQISTGVPEQAPSSSSLTHEPPDLGPQSNGQIAEAPEASPEPITLKRSVDLVNAFTKEVQESNVNLFKVGKQIGKFLDRLFNKLGHLNSSDEGKVRLANLIKKGFEHNFKDLKESEESKRPTKTEADED
jgi:hypothetical protein